MKITKQQLNKLIKEELDKILSEGHSGEGSMAQGQLQRISELANMISQQFNDSTNLEEWVESKITKALDYLSSVMNYMRGESDWYDDEHETLADRKFADWPKDPGIQLGAPSSQDVWDLKNKLGIGKK